MTRQDVARSGQHALLIFAQPRACWDAPSGCCELSRVNSPGATLGAVRTADAVEAIAVEVFRQCECSGEPVTMSVIDRALEQLRGHRRSCQCGLCGETAAKATAERVYRTAWIWQRSVATTRARMTR